MAQETIDVEVWVLIDNAGDYSAGKDAAAAKESYESDVQSVSDADGFRLVKVTLKVPLPEVVELSGTVPADGTAALFAVNSVAG